MGMGANDEPYTSYLGTGWSFPPEFDRNGAVMVSDADDIAQSLQILFGTAVGERFLHPKYGLDMQELLFEPVSTTLTTLVKDRIRIAILIYEPRIEVQSLELDTSQQANGKVVLTLDYVVRATNSRFNLVYPFYMASDASEASSLYATE